MNIEFITAKWGHYFLTDAKKNSNAQKVIPSKVTQLAGEEKGLKKTLLRNSHGYFTAYNLWRNPFRATDCSKQKPCIHPAHIHTYPAQNRCNIMLLKTLREPFFHKMIMHHVYNKFMNIDQTNKKMFSFLWIFQIKIIFFSSEFYISWKFVMLYCWILSNSVLVL